MGANKAPGTALGGLRVGNADEEGNAQGKLERKNLDLIVLNSLNDAGAGFGHDTNQVTLIGRDTNIVRLPLQSKADAARAILDRLEELR